MVLIERRVERRERARKQEFLGLIERVSEQQQIYQEDAHKYFLFSIFLFYLYLHFFISKSHFLFSQADTLSRLEPYYLLK